MFNNLTIRQRLCLIVALLALPLALVLFILLRDAVQNVGKLNRDREALSAVDRLWPTVLVAAQMPDPAGAAARNDAIRTGSAHMQDIISHSELAAGASPTRARLVLDVLGELPNLLLRADALLSDTAIIAGMRPLGSHDRMMFLVDAGQFKVTVERVERALLELADARSSILAASLAEPARQFRWANERMQGAAAAYATTLSAASDGADLAREPLALAQAELLAAADHVWTTTQAHLARSLAARHVELQARLWALSGIVLLMVALALGTAAALSGSILRRINSLETEILALGDRGLDATIAGLAAGDEIGRIARAVAYFRDRTVETITSLLTEEKQRELELLFSASPVAMLLRDDEDDRVVDANEAACALLGRPLDCLRTTSAQELGVAAAGTGAEGGSPRTLHCRHVDGTAIELLAFEKPVRLAGHRLHLVALVDLTERRQAEARIAHMARHDALTALPNRAQFHERLEQAILGSTRRGRSLAVLSLDLDRFKEVNDTLGNLVGDLLLQAIAGRLSPGLPEHVTLARLGGDEFALIQAPCEGPDDAAALARDLLERLAAPFDVAGHRLQVGASIGIALGPDDGASAEALLKAADLALRGAKTDGRGSYRFFEADMNARLRARREIEAGLRIALTEGQLDLHFQPLVQLADGRIRAFEALVRWQHPERGMISPDRFIPLAEELGLIHPIGAWVLNEACRTAAGWPSGVKIAVNVSAVQFRDPAQLLAAVHGALSRSGLDPRRLELEITESVLIAESETTLATLHELRSLGVRIALDDFGTGYSSLSYLRSFPFDKMKIDRSFVSGIGIDDGAVAIIRAVAELGTALGIRTTVEGIETEEQLQAVRAQGCHEVQGYLLGRPGPAADAARRLAAEAAAAAELVADDAPAVTTTRIVRPRRKAFGSVAATTRAAPLSAPLAEIAG